MIAADIGSIASAAIDLIVRLHSKTIFRKTFKVSNFGQMLKLDSIAVPVFAVWLNLTNTVSE